MIACGEEVEETTTSARTSSLGQRVEGARGAAEALREGDRAVAAAVGHEHRRDAVRGEGARDLLGVLARADQHHVALGEIAERGPRGLDRHRGDGGVAGGDRGLGPHALARGQRRAEELVGHRPRRVRAQRALVGALDLALDLGLADDHRVEPADHAVEVPRGVAVTRRVQRARQVPAGARREHGRDRLLRVLADDVELGPVAGRHRDGLGHARVRRQFLQERLDLPVEQRQALADGQGRRLVRRAEREQLGGS